MFEEIAKTYRLDNINVRTKMFPQHLNYIRGKRQDLKSPWDVQKVKDITYSIHIMYFLSGTNIYTLTNK